MSDLTGNTDDLDLDQTLEQTESYDETILGTDDPQDVFPYDSPLTDPDLIEQLNERSDEVGELLLAEDADSTIDGGTLVGAEDGSDSPEEAALHVIGGDAITERDLPGLNQIPPQ
jgi:hypothetical protein